MPCLAQLTRHVWIPSGSMQYNCKELPRFKYQHDLVLNALFDIYRRADISVKKEAHVNLLTGPLEDRPTHKLVDNLVFGLRGRHEQGFPLL